MDGARVSLPLKWHGGKYYLARRIVGLLPRRRLYVEPFAGGLSVLLTRDPTDQVEVVNDLNRRLTNFWRVLQNHGYFAEFQRIVNVLPFSEAEWSAADKALAGGDTVDPVGNAVRFFVHCRQSLAGRQQSFAPISQARPRRGMCEQVSAWLTAVEGLPAVHERLKRVAVLDSQKATDVIRKYDGGETVFYLDPPYLHSTRQDATAYGPYEMSVTDHEDLLDTVLACKGAVAISGYHSDLYDARLGGAGWHCHEYELPNNAAGGEAKRKMVEVVWANF